MVNVSLRLPREIDRAEALALRRISRPQLEPWEPAPPASLDVYGDDWFDRFLATSNTSARVRWFVCREIDNRITGSVGIDQIYRGPFNNGIMGWWCGTPFTGQGYMTAGVIAAIDLAFRPEPLGLSLHRLEANIRPENAASLAVAKKAGMRYEGYSPLYLQIAGRYCDHCRYAIVREDWDFANRRSGNSV